MLKLFKTLFLGLLIIAIILLIILYFSADGIIKNALEANASKALKTPVTVEQVHVNIFKEEITLSNFKIANLAGYKETPLFQAADMTVKINLFSLFSELVVIRDININNPQIYVELHDSKRNNFTDLIKNIRPQDSQVINPQSTPANKDEINSAKPQQNQKGWLIQNFIMKMVKVNVKTAGIVEASAEIPELKLQNIGTNHDKQSFSQLLSQLIISIYRNSVKLSIENADINLKQTLNNAKDSLKKSLDNLSGSVNRSLE